MILNYLNNMTHKEFYIWLEGYLYVKLENKHIDITPIVEKMGQVKDEPETEKLKINPFQPIPMPINPLPNGYDPYKPPYEVYCGDKTQLND
jgi:hypothetical protein